MHVRIVVTVGIEIDVASSKISVHYLDWNHKLVVIEKIP